MIICKNVINIFIFAIINFFRLANYIKYKSFENNKYSYSYYNNIKNIKNSY